MGLDSIYSAQARGDKDAYAAYYASMDRSMQQKIALTTAYFPSRGVLADMGCGSGAGSFDLASLYQGLSVIGVDVAPESVAYAQAHYKRPNLQYRLGDIAEPLFADESLDGILNSSVFHHLTSFNDFSLQPVRRSLDHQTAALKAGGMLIIRDFVIPSGPDQVLLDLPERDGIPDNAGNSVEALSTAALFERFAKQWRSSQNRNTQVAYRRIGFVRPGWVRYQLSHRAACEFILRKDYRRNWAAECKEEYTYFTQAEFETELRARDLRVVLSVELRNPWIVENRFRGHFFLYGIDESPLPYPPTNYLLVGEKVRRGAGVCFALKDIDSAVRPQGTPPPFLRISAYTHCETGHRIELVERPNPVVDLIPWFRQGGQVYVIGKQGFPRPLIGASHDSPNLDGAHVAGYLCEPITQMQAGQNLPLEALPSMLFERTGVLPKHIVGIVQGLRYFTSPGGLSERVTSYLIELCLQDAQDAAELGFASEAPNYTAFTSAGRVQPLLSAQLLRAAAVGGLLDARLEVNTYHLLSQLGEPLGPWIGAEIELREQGTLSSLPSDGAQDCLRLLSPPQRAVFVPCQSPETNFLNVRLCSVSEVDAQGQALATTLLEYALPRPTSANTLSILPVLCSKGEVFIGLELRDLPAAQMATGRSCFVTNPAWRLPRSTRSLDQAAAWLTQQMTWQFGARLLSTFPLGGKYYPATGATPEVVYPWVAEVDGQSVKHCALSFVPLRELWMQRHLIEDGHLLIGLWRLVHAIGLIP